MRARRMMIEGGTSHPDQEGARVVAAVEVASSAAAATASLAMVELGSLALGASSLSLI